MPLLPRTPAPDARLSLARRVTRRAAIASMARFAAAALVVDLRLPSPLSSVGGRVVRHPEPRPGVTAERVLPDARVTPKARESYAAAREFPGVLDGLYCHCECADRHADLRSLLSCFETEMPMRCGICQGEARLAAKLARRGESLARIREAVDEQYG